ncbi:MAG: hypothetical protein GWP15_03470, partial [Nitrospirae bacterium]|nr:hypothetical protein [Nitrospirota bacterium]
ILFAVLAIIISMTILNLAGNFFYFINPVEEQEVGIQFQNRRIENIVGPGVYSDVGIFVDLQTISTQAIPFDVLDEEIITSDKQRIGLKVTGDIFRPGLEDADLIRSQWSRYRGIYLNDDQASSRVGDLARQSMKVCVGDRTFDDNIIGTSRDALRACIDEELNKLVSEFGLRIENLVVPEVILSPAVQVALDAIVQSRLETEKAAQDQLRASAEASAEQAKQEGEIRVEQSRIQEQARQGILLAQLEQEQLAAQLAVIEQQQQNDLATVAKQQAVSLAEKERDFLVAKENLEIARIVAEQAAVDAEARTAVEQLLAGLYETNPEYLSLLLVQANASALNRTDKVIFTPEGMIPTLVLPGPGIVPTVDTTPNTAVPATEGTETSP